MNFSSCQPPKMGNFKIRIIFVSEGVEHLVAAARPVRPHLKLHAPCCSWPSWFQTIHGSETVKEAVPPWPVRFALPLKHLSMLHPSTYTL